MLSSSVLEVVVGLFLVFFVFATICSGVAEWISRALRLRADYLLRGLRNMLDGTGEKQRQGIPVVASTAVGSPGGSEQASPDSSPSASAPDPQPNPDSSSDESVADRLLRLPLVATFGQQRDGDPVNKRFMPSYLPSETFAAAVVDLVVPDESGTTSMDTLITGINDLPDPARSTLLALAKSARGSTTAFRTLVARWYDDNMTRVSGWYKRHVTLFLVGLALVVTVACNINTITLARTLYTNQDARQALVNQADALTICPSGQAARCASQANNAVTRLGQTSLPLFWQTSNPACTTPRAQCSWLERVGLDSASGWAIAVIGWLIAIVALTMGAPFWFNLLSKIASLRATGDPPPKASAEPSVPEPSELSQIAVLERPADT
jgi:hypothetical protein